MNCKDFSHKALFVSYGVIAYLAIACDLVGDVKTKLSTTGCLTANEFVFTSEQHGRFVYEAAFSSYGVTLVTSRSMAIAGDLEFSVDKTIHS